MPATSISGDWARPRASSAPNRPYPATTTLIGPASFAAPAMTAEWYQQTSRSGYSRPPSDPQLAARADVAKQTLAVNRAHHAAALHQWQLIHAGFVHAPEQRQHAVGGNGLRHLRDRRHCL